MLEERQIQAAVLTAHGKSAQTCADEVGCCRKTIERWRLLPEFRAQVLTELQDIRRKIRTTGAAVKEVRIKAIGKRLRALYKIAEKRAGKEEYGGAPWDDTGYMVRRDKMLGSGDMATLVTEYELDTGLLSQMLEHERAIARELGEERGIVDRPEDQDRPQAIAASQTTVNIALYLGREKLQEIKAAVEARNGSGENPNASGTPADGDVRTDPPGSTAP